MYDVIVVGAGASGVMLASILREKNKDIKILILEKNDKICKKLSLTGNSRCNLGNKIVDYSFYNTDEIKKFEIYFNNIKKSHLNDMLNVNYKYENYIEYLKKIGVFIKEENNLLYPYNDQAISVCKAFEKYISKNNIDLICGYEVKNILKEDNYYLINNDKKSKVVVIATGGLSYPKTGSTGDGYKILKSFGHNITKLYPSLVKLKSDFKYLKDLKGVRVDSLVSLILNDKIIKEEKGQVQFTEDFVSGICVFNLSRYVKKYLENNEKVELKINFIPNYNYKELKSKMNDFLNYNVFDFLSLVINNKIALVICKLNNVVNKRIKDIDDLEKNKILNLLYDFKINITDTAGFNFSQVTMGGVKLSEMSLNLESNLKSNLYAIGEIVNVDGVCGGYNLIWAFTSALIASEDIIKKFAC